MAPPTLPDLNMLFKNGYDYIFEMDADFSHDPKEIQEFLRWQLKIHDVVLGSRYINWC
ncbi:MAG: hypothetical protein MZV64_38770 [Ignavibacteriales bacterium]|nr:hypothetical protein [Ignavibacteriales bacterium]